jgi:hypothetical protein
MDGDAMPLDDRHLSDRDLVRAADGELPERRLNEVRSHLASCWACRTRIGEIDEAIAAFIGIQQEADSQLPPVEGPRALLRARLAELEAEPPRRASFSWPQLATAGLAVILITIAALTLRPQAQVRLVPDPRLTPGAVLMVGERDVCAENSGHGRFIPAALGQKVFEEYGIRSPQPRAYELDYLIAPELGGSDDIRNFWPQPFSTAVWNSHVKDALEDRLHELVCTGQISLATAQHDIAVNWVSAYKKYFNTEAPLPDHYAFAKDRPWEQ